MAFVMAAQADKYAVEYQSQHLNPRLFFFQIILYCLSMWTVHGMFL